MRLSGLTTTSARLEIRVSKVRIPRPISRGPGLDPGTGYGFAVAAAGGRPAAAPSGPAEGLAPALGYVSTGRGQDLLDPMTGEIHGTTIIKVVEERDDAEFVKVFAEGVKASFGLTKTAGRVFQVVLEAYQREKMTGGFADSGRSSRSGHAGTGHGAMAPGQRPGP